MCTPYVEKTNCRSQEYRCQLKRETPLRSTSNDVCQVTDRCNVDYQFLVCAPPETAFENDAPQLVPDSVAPIRKRLTKKTKPITKQTLAMSHGKRGIKWLYWCGAINFDSNFLLNFSEAFRKAYGMDFYITKYQGKPMESLTPLFLAMLSGIHRLEQQEEQEQADAEVERQALEDNGGAPQPAAKQRKTGDELARRARRVTIRLASMANRCFWVSAAELVVHILTDGDCLQTHNNIRIFTRQLQWAIQQCKRQLNHEPEDELPDFSHQRVQAVAFQVSTKAARNSASDEHEEENAAGDHAEIERAEACTASTNTSDDYAHRGSKLSTMPFYVYRMYVRRIHKPSRSKACAPTIFMFEPHYAMANTYVQEVVLHAAHVPTIDGFMCPTAQQDPEQNALLKAILFTPWSCTDPMRCSSVMNFAHFLSDGSGTSGTIGDASQLANPIETAGHAAQHAASSSSAKSRPPRTSTLARAWSLRRSELLVLAERADCRCAAARKHLVLADTQLFAERFEPHADILAGEEIKQSLHWFCRRHLRRTMPAQGARIILAFFGFAIQTSR